MQMMIERRSDDMNSILSYRLCSIGDPSLSHAVEEIPTY